MDDKMIYIDKEIYIYEDKIIYKPIRSSGPGGQNVNKVSTGIHLQYNINEHSYPGWFINRLEKVSGGVLSKSGLIIIKANSYRSQIKNKRDALRRMVNIFKNSVSTPKKRIKTKTPYRSRQNRIETKKKNSLKKQMRKPPQMVD
ncbi:MAG: aminoacyl-tRNA hydrolase [Candidatus Marinimicrobia bacterium]|nr:aminoacyl-tRNA hydrolase [Candidatus Neomarinimicrobiota bacterium]|tara:strand:+ start:4584 stop:5015 length:432 start_codon:yes stop_codon:yes gene_type:complete